MTPKGHLENDCPLGMSKARAWPNFRLLISLNEISRSVPFISKEVLE